MGSAPRKALVVDGDFFFVEFLSGLLEKRGYQVSKAYDGQPGIARLEDGPDDIPFADQDTRTIHANAAAMSILGQPLVGLIDRPVWKVFPPNRSREPTAALKATAHGGHPCLG